MVVYVHQCVCVFEHKPKQRMQICYTCKKIKNTHTYTYKIPQSKNLAY